MSGEHFPAKRAMAARAVHALLESPGGPWFLFARAIFFMAFPSWHPSRFLSFVAAVAAFYFLSRELAELSSAALWMPMSWRLSMRLLSVLLGGIVYSLARHMAERPRLLPFRPLARHAKSDAPKKEAPNKREEHRHVRNHVIALFVLGFTIAAVFAYMRLRDQCVIKSGNITTWVNIQRSLDGAEPDAERAGREGKTGGKAEAADHDKEHGEKDPAEKEKEGSRATTKIPDCIDEANAELFVPLWFAPDQQRVIDAAAKPDSSGVQELADTQLDVLLNWNNGPSRDALLRTAYCFALLHLAIVTLFAVVAAFAYSPSSSLGENWPTPTTKG